MMTRRWAMLAVFACTMWIVLPAAAQEGGHEGRAEAAGHEEKAEPPMSLKLINFGILALGLFLIARKSVPAMMRSRTEEIQKDIASAQATKREADQRAAEMEARLKSLGADIEAFRQQAAQDMKHEGERIQQDTLAQIKRIEEQAAVEIESAGKTARRELRQYAGELSLKLAEERVRARLDANTEAGLVDGFVAELGRQGSKN